MSLDTLCPQTIPPPEPVEGSTCIDTNTGMMRTYVGGQWMEPGGYIPHLQEGESFDSCIRKHHTVIKALITQVTELQLKVKALEKIVGTENRFKNVIREVQEPL